MACTNSWRTTSRCESVTMPMSCTPLSTSSASMRAGLFARRQVDLRHVAGDDHLRAHAHAGQKHLHLLGGGVLRLVEYDKGVVKRAAAHVGQRRDLHRPALHQPLIGFQTHHLVQRVVEGAQVGVHLLRQVPGQKAQFFAGLHRRAREYDALNILVFERHHRHGDGQVGLARTRGAYGERAGVLLDGVHILLLPQRLALYLPAAVGDGDDVAHDLADAVGVALAGQFDGVA